MTAIAAPRLFDGERFLPGGVVRIEGDRVAAIGEDDFGEPVHRLPSGAILAPGYVDLQVNGGGGLLLNDAIEVDRLAAIARAHAACGTTSLLPTLISGTRDEIAAALAASRQAHSLGVAGVIGLHVEGPFIAPTRAGIHPAANIVPLEMADVVALAAHATPLLVTLAPERCDEAALAALVSSKVRVFAGHTDATAEQALAAFDAGVTGCTHLFNAMSQFGSRAPGVVGAAFAHGRVHAGIICDGFHAHPASVRAAWRALGPQRLFLVSDAMPTVASDVTSYRWQGEDIRLRDGRLARADGTLAGAHVTLAECVARAVQLCGLPLPDALRMATRSPAAVMGIDDIGRIAAGARADLVALDAELRVIGVWQGGVPVGDVPV